MWNKRKMWWCSYCAKIISRGPKRNPDPRCPWCELRMDAVVLTLDTEGGDGG